MQAGVIGLPDYDFGTVESFAETEQISEHESLTACLEVRRTDSTGDFTFQTGRAAIQELENEEKITIDPEEGSISVSENVNEVKTKYTEFVLVPGEFVAVTSGRGSFAFSMISGQTDTATIKRAGIDLNDFEESYVGEARPESASAWQVGFYGNTGTAEKGAIYGDGVRSDPDLGKVVDRLPKNQIGLDIKEEEGEDDGIRMTATESGYVEVYQPNNYDPEDFAEFVLDHVIPHAKRKEET